MVKVSLSVGKQHVRICFWLYSAVDRVLNLEENRIATIENDDTLNRVIGVIADDAQFNSGYPEYVEQCAQFIKLLKSQPLPITINVLD